jgi:hypothetical protein
MTDENDSGKKKGEGAAATYVETVQGYAGPNITLLASDLKAYTTIQSDSKFGQIASKTQRGQVIIGAGLTVDAQGVIGTNSSAPDWNAITNKPTEFPPSKAGTTVIGGVKVGAGLQITPDGTLYSSTAAPDWSNITNKPAAYPPTTASATQIGGVKQGSGIFIDPQTGTINATGAKPTWDSIEDKPVVFPPPVASATVLGGVKQGNNIEIAADGTIGSYTQWDEILQKPAEFPPTVASASVRGGVFVGSGLTANDSGVLSLSLAQPNEIGGIIPGVTLATDAQSGRIDVVPASKENLGAVKIGDTLYVDDQGFLEANPGAIQPATSDTLGGVKIGAGVGVTAEGVISVPQGYPFARNMKVFRRGAGSWTVPEGCEVFSVTVVGCGGDGGGAWDGNNKAKTGGGGGGGGGWAKVTLKDVPAGTEFGYTAPKTYTDGATVFNQIEGAKIVAMIATANAGKAGKNGDQNDANAFAKGGAGGTVMVGVSSNIVGSVSGTGGEGDDGFQINGKRFCGYGGASLFGGRGWYCEAAGAGGGGGGDNHNPDNLNAAAGQPGLVIVEW